MSDKKNMCEMNVVACCKTEEFKTCKYFSESDVRDDWCEYHDFHGSICTCEQAIAEANPPKRKPLPDGVLPMTKEELKYFQSTFRYPEIDKIIFQEYVLVIKYKICDDYAIQFVDEILYLNTLFDLTGEK